MRMLPSTWNGNEVVGYAAYREPPGTLSTLQRPAEGAALARAGEFDSSSQGSRLAKYIKRPFERLVPAIAGLLVAAALAAGWLNREEQYLTPEEGAGYWLGIAGGTMMLLLLLYPLRKRIRLLRFAGSVKAWFQIHMLLGLLGPTLILFHANFKLASANATVATLSMLTVVASGLVGRYLYSRIHLGLHGRKAEAQELLDDISALEAAICENAGGERGFVSELRALELLLPAPEAGPLGSLTAMLRLRWAANSTIRRLTRRALDLIGERSREEGWTRRQRKAVLSETRNHLLLFSAVLRKAAALAFYTRLFALWHHLHLPLFVMLIITAALHIIAVHLY